MTLNYLKILSAVALLSQTQNPRADEMFSSLDTTPAYREIKETSFAKPYDIIDEYFAIESRQTTVSEAMSVKNSALGYAQDMYDFERVVRYAFSTPSLAYAQAVAEFIVINARPFINRYRDIDSILRLETKLFYVTQNRALKEAGLHLAKTPGDLMLLASSAIANPSAAYLEMLADLIARNSDRVIFWDTPISEILRMESKTRYINQAIAVKTAGLKTIRTRRELLDLSRPAFANPTPQYLQAIDQFRRQNEYRYPY